MIAAFFAGVYVGGMIPVTVVNLFSGEKTLDVVKAAFLWPIGTGRVLFGFLKR